MSTIKALIYKPKEGENSEALVVVTDDDSDPKAMIEAGEYESIYLTADGDWEVDEVPELLPGTIVQSTPSVGTTLTVTGSNEPVDDSTAYQWEQSDDDSTWSSIGGGTAATLGTSGIAAEKYLRRGVATGGQAMVYTPSVQLLAAAGAVGPEVVVNGDEGFVDVAFPTGMDEGMLWAWIGYMNSLGEGTGPTYRFLSSTGLIIRLNGNNNRLQVDGTDGSSSDSYSSPNIGLFATERLYALVAVLIPNGEGGLVLSIRKYDSVNGWSAINGETWAFDSISTAGNMSFGLPAVGTTPATLRDIRSVLYTGLTTLDLDDLSDIQGALVDGEGNVISDPGALSLVVGATPYVDLFGNATRRNAETNGGSADLTGKKSGTFVDAE